MQVVLLGRGGGKTTATLRWMREAPAGEERVMMCESPFVARLLAKQNPDIDAWRFVTPDTVVSLQGHSRPTALRIGIDNVDDILRRMFGVPVSMVTATQP